MHPVPVSIPRWQWRTVAPDLGPLFRRFPVSQCGPERRTAETHLLCLHSSHSAILRDETLEVRWRKETGPEGFELWDTILGISLPFRAEDLERLWAAWELPRPSFKARYATVASFLDEAIASTDRVVPVSLTRRCREARFQGVACSIETIEIPPQTRFQSFSIEHEDPSLVGHLLTRLGLEAAENINLVQGLRQVLRLQAPNARKRHG